MNGIERLREIAALKPFMGGVTQVSLDLLAEIADQIERETLPRPRFEDGEPVQWGDECAFAGGVDVVNSITLYANGRWHVLGRGVYGVTSMDGPLKRPEPPDSWEKLEADVDKGSACRYFGVPDSEEECGKCAAQWDDGDMSCAESMARDVLRRCKKLAGIKED